RMFCDFLNCGMLRGGAMRQIYCGDFSEMAESLEVLHYRITTSDRGGCRMRSSIVRWAVAPVAVLALSFPAIAQRGGRGGAQSAPATQTAPAAQAGQNGKLPGKDSLYQGNRLRPDPTPGGPAPMRGVSGSWAGNLTPQRGEIPPLTP